MRDLKNIKKWAVPLLIASFLAVAVSCKADEKAGSSLSPKPPTGSSDSTELPEAPLPIVSQEPLTYGEIEQAMEQFRDGWKLEEEKTLLAQHYSTYTFVSPEGITFIVSTSAEKRAFNLNTVLFFPPDSRSTIAAFNKDDLPKLIKLVCELYGDVSTHDFEEFWDFLRRAMAINGKKLLTMTK